MKTKKKMKLIIYIQLILFFIPVKLNGQKTFHKDELVESILKSKIYTVYNEPAIVSNLDSSFLHYHLSELKKQESETEFTNRHNGNSIVLTATEKKHIITSLKHQLNLEWQKSQFPNYEMISFEQLKEYLGKDRNNTVVVISEPVYIRNKSLAIIFLSNLCCGRGIGGFVELSIFKMEKNQWIKYVEISSGDF